MYASIIRPISASETFGPFTMMSSGLVHVLKSFVRIV